MMIMTNGDADDVDCGDDAVDNHDGGYYGW